MLSGFKNANGEPCSSSKEFTENQANVFIHLLKSKLGWQEKKKNENLKYENLIARDPKFASPGQLRKIEALWQIHSKEKTEISLNHFISRIVKVDLITSVLKKDVNRLLKAIQSLKNTPSPESPIPSPYEGEGKGEVLKEGKGEVPKADDGGVTQ